MKRKIFSAVLAVCILMTCVTAVGFTATAVTADKSKTGDAPDTYSGITANPYEMAESNDDATVLQVWNWSYKNITAELDKIAKQGFNTIQISPPNEIKTATKGAQVKQDDNQNGWWMFYQPAGFQINQSEDNALGTKDELVAMVKAAHAKGIKVLADTVINHMGTKEGDDYNTSPNVMTHVTPKAKTFEPEIYDNKLFHDPWFKMTYKEKISEFSQDESTYDLTRGCTSGLPDLMTEDPRVQTAIYDYLQELVDCGIDGFRIDAAKHIETPKDMDSYKSEFWPNTVGRVMKYASDNYGKELLSYGEILNNSGVHRMTSWYFPYMKVTNTNAYYGITDNVNSGYAAGVIPGSLSVGNSESDTVESQQKNQAVLWNESHDDYAEGKKPDDTSLVKRWAAMASRDGITSMFLARPESDSQDLGVASETLWCTSSAVKAINEFNNYYSGIGEYLQNSLGTAIIGRGSKESGGGAVLINCDSGTSKYVSNLKVQTLADGSYIDKISGSSFTVSRGKLKGTIGDSGVAVLYNAGPIVHGTSSCYYAGDSITAKFVSKKVDYATYSVNTSAERRFTSGDKISFGSPEDTKGATYVVTLKGYVGGEAVTSASFAYTKNYNTVTLKTNDVSGWADVPYIHYWNGTTSQETSWPGVKMNESNGDYTFDLPADIENLIFTMGSSGPQTVNLSVGGNTVYTLLTSKDSEGHYRVSAETNFEPIEPYYPGVVQPTFVSEYAFGDVDRDGKVNINDVTMIQQRLVFLINFDVEQANLADFNRDGKLNIHDATAIQYKLAGIEIS